MARILLVEDEHDIRSLIALHLKREGYQIDEASSGEEGATLATRNPYDLYVLDWMLPGMSGLEITKTLRNRLGPATPPVLMVTARVDAADIVMGLEAGADDYMTKPFEIPVLIARVRALLRRTENAKAKPTDELRLGQLTLNLGAHEASCKGAPVHLTPYEFKLLAALLQNTGKVLTREKLIELVQGSGVAVVDRAIDTHVFGLRKKLGDCSALIETIRGVGYRVRAHADESA